MSKEFKLFLLSAIYFIPIFYVLFFLYTHQNYDHSKSSIFDNIALYSVGSFYSVFIFIFLSTITPLKSFKQGLIITLALIIAWLVLVYIFLPSLMVIGLMYSGGIILTIFLGTLAGTFWFLSILSKWNNRIASDIKILPCLVFAITTTLFTIPLIEKTTNGLGFHFISFTNLFLVSIVWQLAMTLYLWKKTGSNEQQINIPRDKDMDHIIVAPLVNNS